MIQRERETEGDEFADKDKFVTQAYKDQMAEVRRAEAEEKKREGSSVHFSIWLLPLLFTLVYFMLLTELERSKKGSSGMTHFYRELLDRSSHEHAAAVQAASSSSSVLGPTLPESAPAPTNLTIQKPLKPAAKSDALLAQLAKDVGKDVELNDSNEIVDKRELLSAGLNLSAPNTRKLGGLLSSSRTRLAPGEIVETHRAAGTAASKKEIKERQQRLLERQLAEEQERVIQMKEEREKEERERIIRKRNGEDEVKSAKERYLERKRRKLNGEGPEGDPQGLGGDN